MGSNIKAIVALALAALLVIFTLQNTESVDVRFLFFSLSMSRALMYFIVFALGAIFGFLWSSMSLRKQGKSRPEK